MSNAKIILLIGYALLLVWDTITHGFMDALFLLGISLSTYGVASVIADKIHNDINK